MVKNGTISLDSVSVAYNADDKSAADSAKFTAALDYTNDSYYGICPERVSCANCWNVADGMEGHNGVNYICDL